MLLERSLTPPNRRHSLADVRFRADFVRFTLNNGHSHDLG
jgi:hypothetical protein